MTDFITTEAAKKSYEHAHRCCANIIIITDKRRRSSRISSKIYQQYIQDL